MIVSDFEGVQIGKALKNVFEYNGQVLKECSTFQLSSQLYTPAETVIQ